MFICDICKNQDEKYIGYKNGEPYCRKCISFQGRQAQENNNKSFKSKLNLSYRLSKDQYRASFQIISAIEKKQNVLISAVCGAGKTELTYKVIHQSLILGKQVGFAIPRRDVVIEIFQRLKYVFPLNTVIAVYGGHHQILEGEIIVLTTHQLFRYENYFDLLIVDETDAFPFAGDEVLMNLLKRSLKGEYVMMSATVEKNYLSNFQKEGGCLISLDQRYHGHPLPVPQIKEKIGLLKYFFLLRKLKEYIQKQQPVFIFTPTIFLCEELFNFLNKWVKGGNYVHSKRENRSQIISDFRLSKYSFLVTTSVLERGVTIKNLQVVVFESDHPIYNKATLVQIAGRVGRKIDAPSGDVLFIANKTTKFMKEAINEINTKNKSL